MKKTLLLSALCLCTLVQTKAADEVDYVSTLVGTASKFELSTGNTYPAIAMPWGMNFWVPQTGKMGNGWTYVYWADKIRGFKQTHQPSPWINDYGQFSVMPVTGEAVFDEEKRASWFSHKAEVARPYYYKVYLADHDVTAELAPTERAVAMRFTFPQTDKAYIVLDAFDKGSHAEIIPSKNMIVGYTTKNSGGVPENFKNYFVLVFDRPFKYTAAVTDGNIDASSLSSTSNHSGAIVGFSTKRGEQVNVRVASSFISPEQALLNLKELGDDGNFFMGGMGFSPELAKKFMPEAIKVQDKYYTPRSNQPFDSDSIQEAVMLMVLAQAIEKAGGPDTEKVLQVLRTEEFPSIMSLSGSVKFGEDGQNVKALSVITQLESQKYNTVFPLKYKDSEPTFPMTPWDKR